MIKDTGNIFMHFFLEKKIIKWFLLYMSMAATLSCDQGHLNKILFPHHRKFEFNWPSGFREYV